MKHWIILPYRNNPDLTAEALADCYHQTIDHPAVLLIANGASDLLITDGESEDLASFVFSPGLALAAVWNTALRVIWASGEDQALVINNDIRMHPCTYEVLLACQRQTAAYLVSAVGVTAKDFSGGAYIDAWKPWESLDALITNPGGPDFSCFLITKEGHAKYPFDEHFHPAYCEDLDYHRRMLLGGDGDRIFSVNLPFCHYASGTLKGMRDDDRQRTEEAISRGSRAYYRLKWGGDVNQEIYTRPFDPTSRAAGVTTPELQRTLREGG